MIRIILLATSLWLAGPALAATISTQLPTCVPTSAEAAKWPIKIVYLHGLYPATGQFKPEDGYRQALSDMGARLHMRIAVPVSPFVSRDHVRSWNTQSLAQIEALSIDACGGEALDDHRLIIGFSNGGYAARRISNLDCDLLKRNYTELMGFGAPYVSTPWGKCLPYVNVNAHVFPPAKGLDYYVLGGH